jgi:hypothetical protein
MRTGSGRPPSGVYARTTARLVVEAHRANEHGLLAHVDPDACRQVAVGLEAPREVVAVELLAEGVLEPLAVLEADRERRPVRAVGDRGDVDEVEPGGSDTRQQDVADVIATETVDEATDARRGVAPADGTRGEDDPVDHAVRADDGTAEGTPG